MRARLPASLAPHPADMDVDRVGSHGVCFVVPDLGGDHPPCHARRRPANEELDRATSPSRSARPVRPPRSPLVWRDRSAGRRTPALGPAPAVDGVAARGHARSARRSRTASPGSRRAPPLRPATRSGAASRAVNMRMGVRSPLRLASVTTSSPVRSRHAPIQDRDVVVVRAQVPERGRAVRDGIDHVAVLPQPAFEHRPKPDVVLGDEHPHRIGKPTCDMTNQARVARLPGGARLAVIISSGSARTLRQPWTTSTDPRVTPERPARQITVRRTRDRYSPMARARAQPACGG